jgi:NADH-quinone oxidoreductase subunit F
MSKIMNLISLENYINPVSIDEYVKIGGLNEQKKAVGMNAETLIGEVKKAKLLGRGGAA